MNEQEELIFDKAVQDFVGDEMEIHVDEEKLQAFLTATEPIQILRGERLRQLAIRLELESYVDEWSGYYRIYEAAIASLLSRGSGATNSCGGRAAVRTLFQSFTGAATRTFSK